MKGYSKEQILGMFTRSMQKKRRELIIAGDLNARVGKDADKWNWVIGVNGDEKMNNNGKELLELCIDNDLVIANTHFKPKYIHKFTREMASRREKSITDYVIIEN